LKEFSLSSSDNPQFDPQPVSSTEASQITFPGTIAVTETLKVTQIASSKYRLQNSSVFGEGYYGDVVEVLRDENGKNRFVRVVSPSGLKVDVFVLAEEILASREVESFLSRILTLDGVCERAHGGVLFIHLPPESNMDAQKELQKFTQRSKA